ncbi:hypothetical protein [Candidatus Pelagibacter sp. HIMB1495]|uniref:hypothetical protein n=1 Tax=unclassified Candidatus Pelagibacter TaxID=2647897 RepID=UPI003F837686
MKWKKLGLIVKPEQFNLKWWNSYAMDPCTLKLKGDLYRVFFCGRNKKNISMIGYFDYDLKELAIKNISKKPILTPGELGTFDDNGVTASCLIKNKKETFLYYIGWKPKSTTRYSLMTGLAISKNNGVSFKRYSRSPILKLTNKEPFSILTAPYVMRIKKDKWLMWYVSCNEWVNENYPKYDIKLAVSKDGKNWLQDGNSSIKLKNEERAIARPSVLFENGLYKMWFCYEKKVGKYKIGYAESKDAINWKRNDKKSFISPGRKEIDNKMIAYPHVVKHKKIKYMFYNGNDYGKEGVCLAIEE